MTALRVVYADLDGTLTGPGGSLYEGPDGRPSIRAAEAVLALHRAGVALVPTSGRNAEQTREATRLLGGSGFIAELGGLLAMGVEAEPERLAGDGEPPVVAMARSGAAALLLEAFPGRLEPHAPWAFHGREVTMLFRGLVEADAAVSVLREAGHHGLDLVDNGAIGRSFPGLSVPETHAYHLLPRGVGKGAAIAADLARRNIEPGDALVVGDSPADVGAAASVAEVVLVANGAWAASGAPANVTVVESPYGDGFAEAVERALAEG